MNITSADKNGTYGGLFGDMRGAVKNLNVSGTVTVTNNNSDLIYVGGVVGEADNATVENCSFAGKVTGTGGGIYVGGVVGTVKEGTTVKNCYHTGAVTGTVTGTRRRLCRRCGGPGRIVAPPWKTAIIPRCHQHRRRQCRRRGGPGA